jgi:NADH-quinone oxidoreductase subunit G
LIARSAIRRANAGSRIQRRVRPSGFPFPREQSEEAKNVELGSRVTLDDERCILCSRCIGFAKRLRTTMSSGSSTAVATPSHGPSGQATGEQLLTQHRRHLPGRALTSADFRFKMRVWFLKETKSFCTSCATGCNTIIGFARECDLSPDPRENDAVNSSWMCDYGRLNFDYLQSDRRLFEPLVRENNALQPVTWKQAIESVAAQLKPQAGGQTAILASGRMTNEELWLTGRFAQLLGVTLIDIVPRTGEGDDILLSADRNPNTNGARLLKIGSGSGEVLQQIKQAIGSGQIRALISLGENPLRIGVTIEQLEKLPVYVVLDLLSNESTALASAVLPSLGFAEKRGSMINGKGRLQRLNRAVRGPGQARDDWEILRDLIQALAGGNGIYTIEDVFRQMSEVVPELHGLTLSRITDLGVQLMQTDRSPDAPGEPAREKVREREKEKHPQ